MKAICNKCKSNMTPNEFEYSNGCNEEGEEYCEIQAECSYCGEEYEWSEWGECESLNEAREFFHYQFN